MEKSYLVNDLCIWYKENARALPWRLDVTPYHVWVSEIMLQQTRVEAVKPYYERFMNELPDIKALAECAEDKYLKLWEGLGYYSRVRNLHAAAIQIMNEYEGQMPSEYAELLKLKGIGSYTAGAISSIAFGKKQPAVDGNVLRVIMRLYGYDWDIAKEDTKKKVEQLLFEWYELNGVESATLTQALMELGALVCVPNGAPHCEACPWKADCKTYEEENWDAIPVKTGKKPRRIENLTVFILQNQEGIHFGKRGEKGLLAGLYEFPNTVGHLSQDEAIAYLKECGYHPIRIREIDSAKHIFSHVEWHMIGYQVLVEEEYEASTIYVDIDTAKNDIAIPSAFRTYKKYIGVET